MSWFSSDTKSTSKQTTNSTSTQDTSNPSVSGVVTGDVYAGRSVVVEGLAGVNLSNAISGLINLTQSGLDLAGSASEAAVLSSEKSAQNVTLPSASLMDKIVPIAVIAVLGIFAWKVFK